MVQIPRCFGGGLFDVWCLVQILRINSKKNRTYYLAWPLLQEFIRRRWVVHRVPSSLVGPVEPLFRVPSGCLNFTDQRHKFNKDSLYRSVPLMMQTCSAIAGLALNDELDAKLLVETGAVEVPKVDRFVPRPRDVHLRIARYRRTWPC